MDLVLLTYTAPANITCYKMEKDYPFWFLLCNDKAVLHFLGWTSSPKQINTILENLSVISKDDYLHFGFKFIMANKLWFSKDKDVTRLQLEKTVPVSGLYTSTFYILLSP